MADGPNVATFRHAVRMISGAQGDAPIQPIRECLLGGRIDELQTRLVQFVRRGATWLLQRAHAVFIRATSAGIVRHMIALLAIAIDAGQQDVFPNGLAAG